MTRDAVSAAFNIKNIKFAIEECFIDIPQVYREGPPVEEALQRVKDVEGIFAVSSDRVLAIIGCDLYQPPQS